VRAFCSAAPPSTRKGSPGSARTAAYAAGSTFWPDRSSGSAATTQRSWPSVKVAIAATAVALVLGTLAAMGLRRTKFFGRNVVSLLIILPIALPGIVTGLAFQNGFRPNQASIVNVVAAVLVVFSAVPIYLAQRLSGSSAEAMTGAR